MSSKPLHGLLSVQMDVLVIDRQIVDAAIGWGDPARHLAGLDDLLHQAAHIGAVGLRGQPLDRKSTRLNSSHGYISYAVFCLKKKIQMNFDSYIFSITASVLAETKL